jgi:hypothetical protein
MDEVKDNETNVAEGNDESTVESKHESTAKSEDESMVKPEDESMAKPEDESTVKPEDESTVKPEDNYDDELMVSEGEEFLNYYYCYDGLCYGYDQDDVNRWDVDAECPGT